MRIASSIVKRGLVGLSAAALSVAVLGATQASASTTAATIDTYPAWDGATMVQPFGCPDTTTYGETITAPAGKQKLTRVTFPWINLTPTGSMKVRGYVYEWNGTGATGSVVGKSKAKKVSFVDGVYHNVSFKFKGAKVKAGTQYVVFASISAYYEDCTDGYEVGWGLVGAGDPYTDGGFVYQNNAGDESQWTTQPWSSFGTSDVAFKAFLK